MDIIKALADIMKVKSSVMFCVYVSAIVFLGSLFFPIQTVSPSVAPTQTLTSSLVQSKSLTILVLGVILWFVGDIIQCRVDYVNDTKQHHQKDEFVTYTLILVVLAISYIAVSVLVLLK